MSVIRKPAKGAPEFTDELEALIFECVWRQEDVGDLRAIAEEEPLRFHGVEVGWDRRTRVYTAEPDRPGLRAWLVEWLRVEPRCLDIVKSSGFVAQAVPGTQAAHKAQAVLNHYGRVGGNARDKSNGAIVLVSNNHVFADCNRGQPGDAIVDRNGQQIASLLKFHPLSYQPGQNDIDASCATPTVSPVFKPRGMATPSPNTQVGMLGRQGAAGHLLGRGGFRVAFPSLGGTQLDFFCYSVQGMGGAFSVPGDSGSLVEDQAGAVLGMVVAGSGSVTLICDAQEISNQLALDF